MDGYYPINSPVLLKHPHTTDKNKENHQTIMESTKSLQELQLTPTMWTQPICFFNYPGQSSNKPPGAMPYVGPFVPSAPQDQGFPQASFRHTSPSQPNYMQVQAQTVQFLPRSNLDNRLQAQGIGPTGPTTLNVPIYPMNQQQSGTDMPYFCTYIPIPTYNLPPIAGMSQSSRSSKVEPTELKSNLRDPQRSLMLTPKDTNPPQQNYYPWSKRNLEPCGFPRSARLHRSRVMS